MPPGPPHRPQTLRQAKKAYRKSGATVRLSDSELALIERRAVLQERADRIREREARRKANLKKKEEKNEKEREMRQRMNLQSPTKGGFYVGPSQLHLGDFMVMGGKRKREEAPSIDRKATNADLMNSESKSILASTGSPPLRNPLQETSANTMTKVKTPKNIEGLEHLEHEIKESQQITTKPVPTAYSRNSVPVSCTKPTALPIPLAELEASKIRGKARKAMEPDEMSPMGPPPLPNPSKFKSTPPSTHQTRALSAPQGNPPSHTIDPWDDFFVSNTQIVREISLPTFSPAPKPARPTNPSSSPPPLSQDSTTSLPSHLSTQDLDTSDILTRPLIPSPPAAATNITTTSPNAAFSNTTTISSLLLQISTQDLDFSSSYSSSPSKSQPQRKGSSEFNEDVTEEDLEDLVLEYEMQSSWRPKNVAETEAEAEADVESDRRKTYEIEDEAFDSELSTQDWRELDIACECTG